MVFAFDTLAYARHLRDAGVPADQAEAHAEAAREFIMAELVTKPDLLATRDDLRDSLATLRREVQGEIGNLRREVQDEIGNLRREVQDEIGNLKREVQDEIGNLKREVQDEIGNLRREVQDNKRELEAKMDTLGLRLTVRLGGMIAVAVAILAAIMKL